MRYCNHCDKEFPDEVQACPDCGEVFETEECTEAEVLLTEETAETEEAAPKKKKTGLIVGIVLAVVAVIAVAVALLLPKNGAEAGAEDVLQQQKGHHVNAYGYPSHSVHYNIAEDGTITYLYMNENAETVSMTQDEVDKLMDTKIISNGKHTLTNRTLPYYYEQQYYNFYMSYSSYINYMMDTTKGLDEQMHYAGSTTWQQYMIDSGIQYFLQTTTLYDQAMAAGYELSEEEQLSLDDLETDLTYFAMQYGMSTAEEYLQGFYGPYATLDDYKEFLVICTVADGYAYELAQQTDVTDEAVSAYYDENAETIQANYGVFKEDKNMVNVRHILIQPESTKLEDGTTGITDEAWAAAEAEAQRIYQLWLDGEATEKSFAALATEYTTDPGSQSTGGLYENVYPGQMVTEFNDWCFADGRVTGDHGIVKTTYGYHIMFFSAEGTEIYWRTMTRDLMLSEALSNIWLDAAKVQKIGSKMSKAVLLVPTLPTAPTEMETATK